MKTSTDKSTTRLCSPSTSPTPTTKGVIYFYKLSGPGVLIPGLLCGCKGTTHVSQSLSKQWAQLYTGISDALVQLDTPCLLWFMFLPQGLRQIAKTLIF